MPRLAHFTGQWGEDLVADDRDGGDSAACFGRHVVVSGAPGFLDQVLDPELAKVVGGLAESVAVGTLPERRCTLATRSATVKALGWPTER